MDIEALKTTVLDFVRLHQAWAPFVVFALAFCESLAIISLFVPATVLLLGIGGLIGGAGLDFWPIWVGAALGASFGDWLSYEVGRYLENRAHHVWPLNRYPQMIAKGEAFTRKYGVWAIFLGRFFGPARAFVPLAAGVFEMPRAPFQVANVASALLWAFLMLAPGTGLTRWLL
ncbi:MAG TPA: DedA family protein [Beijerinckiaceae bacterium]|jgi:membrane protein DedA with SNARE-associated domain